MPHPRTLAALAVASLLIVAGCGGDDENSSDSAASKPPASTTTQSSEAAAPAPATDAPPYEEVKKIALADPGVKSLCSGKVEDRDIGQSPPGETYKRLFCRGTPIVDYTVGKELYGENWKAAVNLSSDPLWHIEGQAYVKPEAASLSNDFAEKVEKLCDCGEIVKGGFGN